MSLLQQIKTAQLTARKARDETASLVLTTLIGEAEAIGKNAGNRPTTDSEVVALVKKFIKNIDETLGLIKQSDAAVGLERERAVLSVYLPTQMTSEQLRAVIAQLSEELNAHTQRDMGKVMKALKERYDGQYDGAAASALIKEVLA